jgi:hypothetical protein
MHCRALRTTFAPTDPLVALSSPNGYLRGECCSPLTAIMAIRYTIQGAFFV